MQNRSRLLMRYRYEGFEAIAKKKFSSAYCWWKKTQTTQMDCDLSSTRMWKPMQFSETKCLTCIYCNPRVRRIVGECDHPAWCFSLVEQSTQTAATRFLLLPTQYCSRIQSNDIFWNRLSCWWCLYHLCSCIVVFWFCELSSPLMFWVVVATRQRGSLAKEKLRQWRLLHQMTT